VIHCAFNHDFSRFAANCELAPGRAATEEDELVSRGLRASVIRLSQVHDPEKQGFVSYMIAVAREKGVSAYVGDGSTRWAAPQRQRGILVSSELSQASTCRLRAH
jgi:hypothetical protein